MPMFPVEAFENTIGKFVAIAEAINLNRARAQSAVADGARNRNRNGSHEHENPIRWPRLLHTVTLQEGRAQQTTRLAAVTEEFRLHACGHGWPGLESLREQFG